MRRRASDLPLCCAAQVNTMFERLILNRVVQHVDGKITTEHAGFRQGKWCTDQLLNLTKYIDDGFEKD